MRLSLNRFCAILALVAAALCSTVAIQRGYHAWQAAHTPPGVVVTSGYEEESLLAIWRVIHNEKLYQDALQIPYASAYFNWLFYLSYGEVTAPFAHEIGDHMITVIGRLFTFSGACLSSLALVYFALQLRSKEARSIQWATGAFSILVFLGPFTGWWIHTVRPDIWALVLESMGLIWFLLNYRINKRSSVLGAGICFYLAWAFKHSFVQGLLAVTVFLIIERQWKWIIRLLLGLALAWLLTIVVGGAEYRGWLIHDVGNSQYSLALGLGNLRSALFKMAPLLIVASAAIPFGISTPLARDTRRLAIYALPILIAFSFLTSCKMGAADNYYFSASALVALLALTIDFRRATSWFWIPACCLSTAFSVFLLTHPSPLRTKTLEARWDMWKDATEPRFSEDTKFNLPWLNPMSPPFVLAFHYQSDRQNNKTFERNGIGGLISEGYFSSLLLYNSSNDSYDGASLANYEQISTVEGMTLYQRKVQQAQFPTH